jgi:uncharacterized protein
VVLAVLLLAAFPSVYGGDCFEDGDVDDCRVKGEQGDTTAYYELGSRYERGKGVLQNYQKAFKWYRKTALFSKVPDPISTFQVGRMFISGRGVSQDLQTGFEWVKASADVGYLDAQLLLGLMYGSGKGTLQNYVMSHMYFNLASISSIGTEERRKQATEMRDAITKQMTPSQIAEAQKIAENWEVNFQQFDKFIELESKKSISFD